VPESQIPAPKPNPHPQLIQNTLDTAIIFSGHPENTVLDFGHLSLQTPFPLADFLPAA
jgi:hypothetical protein